MAHSRDKTIPLLLITNRAHRIRISVIYTGGGNNNLITPYVAALLVLPQRTEYNIGLGCHSLGKAVPSKEYVPLAGRLWRCNQSGSVRQCLCKIHVAPLIHKGDFMNARDLLNQSSGIQIGHHGSRNTVCFSIVIHIPAGKNVRRSTIVNGLHYRRDDYLIHATRLTENQFTCTISKVGICPLITVIY